VLAETGDRVVVVDKLTYAANPLTVEEWRREPRVTFVQADIADEARMQRVVAEHRPVAMLNLAAETHVDRSIDSPRPFVDTNISGTFVLLEAARRYAASLGEAAAGAFRFLHVSTDEVYGSLGDQGRFTEQTPYAPNSPYAASKAGADHLVRAYFHTFGLQTIITNCSNNYGPRQHPEKLIPLMVLNALEAKPLPIYGDGRNVRDWLHVGDHCDAILTVLRRGRPGEHYNIGADNELPNLAVVDHVCDALEAIAPAAANPAMRAAGKSHYRELRQFVRDRPGHDRRYAIDATKVRGELGWRPRRSFADGMRSTAAWYVANDAWCAAGRAGYTRERLGLGAAAAGPGTV
jgi:dTDP-glucose 4,6-dehydratase